MRILIFGADGMLGHKILQMLSSRFETFGTFRDQSNIFDLYPAITDINRIRFFFRVDANNLNAVEKVIVEVQPQIVINCIGIVKQREDAKVAIPSIQVNALFPHQLADLCHTRGARLIHFSTDCVFSGNRGKYTENDLPDPVDLYGRTKLLGELDRSGCLTIRTSIVGWELKNRAGLLEWFASQRGRIIKGYRRAIYSGLTTAAISRLIDIHLLDKPELNGLYHVASKPINKYDLLVRLRETLGWNDIIIEPDDIFQCDRSLMGTRFETMIGWSPPTWDEMIAELSQEWHTYNPSKEGIL
jgi:dTDP-4-dehydrorhamnose reductase